MNVNFKKLTEVTDEIAENFGRWENDAVLIPFIRPNKDEAALEAREPVTVTDIVKRLEHHHIFLIYLEGQLVGEMDYQIDPRYLFKKESGTAWIGITIGEKMARGKGVGYLALQYLEEQIRIHGLKRIELGVFEFNTQAIKLYKRLGYREIGRIDDFSYWQGKLWQDIRMEKYLE